MSLTVDLKINNSPVEKIGKDIVSGGSYSCLLKENTSILKPSIIIKSSDPIYNYNYMYISEFGRYYFIDDIISLNNERWEVRGHVDVLETYKTQILSNTAVIKRQLAKYNTYLNDPEWKTYAYEQKIAYKLSGTPFTKDLKYILTVAGA